MTWTIFAMIACTGAGALVATVICFGAWQKWRWRCVELEHELAQSQERMPRDIDEIWREI